MKPEDRVRVTSTIRLRARGVIADAVTFGVVRGWDEVHESDDEPSEDNVIETISDAVMASLASVIEFEAEK